MTRLVSLRPVSIVAKCYKEVEKTSTMMCRLYKSDCKYLGTDKHSLRNPRKCANRYNS